MDAERHFLEFSRHSNLQPHRDKIVGMSLDRVRNYLYTIAYDKRLSIIDLNEKKVVFTMKGFNAKFRAICLDEQLRRLYASSYEGQLFIFNISGIIPIVAHTFTLAPDQGYVKQLNLDVQRNLLFCLTSTSAILIFQLDIKKESNSIQVASLNG